MPRDDIPKGLEVQHLNGFLFGFYHHWTICEHVVLKNTRNVPVTTNSFGHKTEWIESVDRDPCPTCADADRRTAGAAAVKHIEKPMSRDNKPFTTTLNMSCMHMTFREGGTRGEDPMFIDSSNLTSTANNTDNNEGLCELCDLMKPKPPQDMFLTDRSIQLFK